MQLLRTQTTNEYVGFARALQSPSFHCLPSYSFIVLPSSLFFCQLFSRASGAPAHRLLLTDDRFFDSDLTVFIK